MGAKQDIVIVNEFTVKKGSGGTRGKSPGRYVLQYMLRKSAAEPLSPVSYRSVADYQLRYMLRKEATESVDYINELKASFNSSQGLSGLGFSKNNISLSDKEAHDVADIIQLSFDSGHTVQKIVISFTEDFLKRTGIVDEAFSYGGPGSYSGNLDQLKLRHAIQEGMNRMTEKGYFEDPEYMGCIQVDTGHVHCHLACVDVGISNKRLKDNGEARGMINEKEKKELRRGILNALSELEIQKSFFNQVDLERRNVVSFVKDFAHKRIKDSSSLQLLLASLPPDKRLWRYSSNRRVMTRPNEIAEDIVESVFTDYPELSGYNRAMRAIRRYAKEKSAETNIPRMEYIENGRNLLIERTVNGMYDTLKNLDYVQPISTGMINLAKRDIDELVSKSTGEPFDPVGFELRIRGYKTRRNYHLQKSHEYFQNIREYDSQQADPTSIVIRNFYQVELLYHRMVCDKYRYFLSFKGIKEEEDEESLKKEVANLRDRITLLNSEDELLNNPPPYDGYPREEIDRRIESEYGIANGSWYFNSSLRQGLLERYEEKRKVLEEDKEILKQKAFEKGFIVFSDSSNRAIIDPEKELMFDFNVTKALDLHNLTFDFPMGANVSMRNINAFTRMYQLRRESLENALLYIRSTGQDEHLLDTVKNDIDDMQDVLDELRISHGLPAYQFSTSSMMQRQNAPRIENIARELDIVRESIPTITENDVELPQNS